MFVRFTRRHRLSRKADFDAALRRPAVRRRAQGCRLYARPNAVQVPRLGFIVAKRHVKHAVRRNRVKRIIRESFRTAPALPAFDIVIQVTAEPAAEELRAILSHFWDVLRAETLRQGETSPADPTTQDARSDPQGTHQRRT